MHLRPATIPARHGSGRVLLAAGFCLVALSLLAAPKKAPKTKAKPKIPPGKPEIFQMEPRGIQRGVPATVKLIGTNLIGLTELKLYEAKLRGELLEKPPATTNEAWIRITAATNL